MRTPTSKTAGLVQFPPYLAFDVPGRTSLIAVGGVALQLDAQAIEDALEVRTRASVRCLRDFDGVALQTELRLPRNSQPGNRLA
jgi:hypothetical protein